MKRCSFALLLALAGCASGPKCPEPAATQCMGAVAQVCSSERRWEDVMDCNGLTSTAGEVPWVCCGVETDGVVTHSCVPRTLCGKAGNQ
jgi:hypothetical protein